MKILLATDGAAQSGAAIELIRSFRITNEDEVKVVCVVDMALPMSIDIYGGYVPDTSEMEKDARENAGKIVDETVAKVKSFFKDIEVNVTGDVLFGSPDSRIVETAEEDGTDLIIVGSHGYSRWERLLLGSTSDSVVHHAPCSVLIVRLPPE